MSRIFLKSIRLKNFKSYKDIQEAGPCHIKVNVIIGPNGTGKSNFLDAILFVLGKRAWQLRFKKLADIINYTESTANQFASVCLSFNHDMKTPLSTQFISSEISISRQIFLNNSSFYYFNGKEIPFLLLKKALKMIGIAAKNERFLIQQGEIERISTMKSKNDFSNEVGMIEYTEDIFGSSRYVKNINKKKKFIDKISEDLRFRKNSMREKEFFATFFQNKIWIIDTFFSKKWKTLAALKIFYLDRMIEILCWNIKKKEHIRQKMSFWKNYCAKFVKFSVDFDWCTELSINLKNLSLARKLIFLSLENVFLKIKRKIFVIKQEHKYVIQQKMFLNTKNKRKLLDLSQTRFMVLNLMDKLNVFCQHDFIDKFSIGTRIKNDNQQYQSMCFLEIYNINLFSVKKKPYDNFRCIIDNATTNKIYLNDFIYYFGQYLYKFETEHDCFEKYGFDCCQFDKKFQLNSFFAKQKFLQVKIRLLYFLMTSKKLSTLLDHLEKMFLSINITTSYVQRVKHKLLSIYTDSMDKKERLSSRKRKYLEIYMENRVAKTKKLNLNSLTENICFLNQLDSLSKTNSFLHIRNLFNKNSNKKFDTITQSVPGIIGLVGSLGFVKTYYSIAFFSILSGMLNTILIDTYSNCTFAIEFLQKNKIGRSFFLVNEKLRTSNSSKNVAAVKTDVHMIDLIYSKNKFKHLFAFILGETILVKSLKEGLARRSTKIEMKRIVTLDGKQIEMSGILSGGGLSTNALTFINKKERECVMWIHLFKFYYMQSKYYMRNFLSARKLDEMSCTTNLRSFSINQQKQIKKSVHFFLKWHLYEQKSKMRLSIEKNIVCNFKKKIIFSENEKYIHGIFIRTINLRLGFRILFCLRDRKQKNLLIQNTFSYMSPVINIAIADNLKFLRNCQKKILTENLFRSIYDTNTIGIYLKKKSKISKLVVNLYTHFFLISTKKSLEFCYFNKYSPNMNRKTTVNLLKKKGYDYEEEKNYLSRMQKKIKLEIKIIFLFFEKLKYLAGNKFLDEYFQKKAKNFLDIDFNAFVSTTTNFHCKKKKSHLLGSLINFKKLHTVSFAFFLELYKSSLSNKAYNSNSQKRYKKKFFCRKINFSSHSQRIAEYVSNFFAFDSYLKIVFPIISKGGIMETNMVDYTDPFIDGISLFIKPPEKSWKLISFLSGGEKTLSSLAVVFSLQDLKPASWYLLDEIDAALDFRNVNKVSDYLSLQSVNSQIIIVSLRNNILLKADQILGVYKVYGASKFISIRNDKF